MIGEKTSERCALTVCFLAVRDVPMPIQYGPVWHGPQVQKMKVQLMQKKIITVIKKKTNNKTWEKKKKKLQSSELQ